MVDEPGRQDSDTAFLSEDAPAHPDRRRNARHLTILRVGKLASSETQELCLIRNISAGGIMAHVYLPHQVGERIMVELKGGHRLPATVRWVRPGHIGAQFDTPVDIEAVLAADPAEPGTRPRAPRLEIMRRARISVRDTMADAVVRDFSQGGARIETEEAIAAGETIFITIDGFDTKRAIVRWARGNDHGLEFTQTIKLQDFMTGLQNAQ